jgi:hypothetical protein
VKNGVGILGVGGEKVDRHGVPRNAWDQTAAVRCLEENQFPLTRASCHQRGISRSLERVTEDIRPPQNDTLADTVIPVRW